MALLIDTHALVWLAEGSRKLSKKASEAIRAGDADLFVSAVTAFELADLAARRRIPTTVELGRLLDAFGMTVLDFPADLWRSASTLPYVHGDPVDRMLFAHAIHADMTLVTADDKAPQYSVRTLW